MVKKFILCFSLLVLVCSCAKENKPQESFVDVKDAKLFCRTLGKGTPLIVLHGGPGLSQEYLQPHLYKLAENHFVIFYDQRGCGKSTGEINADTINMATYVSDLDAIRQAFKLEKIAVLGHAWGGFLAMEYAIAHPESVSKLILSNTMPVSSEEYERYVKEFLIRTTPIQMQLNEIQGQPKFRLGDPETVENYYRLVFRTYCYNQEKANLLNLSTSQTAAVNAPRVYAKIRHDVFVKKFNLHDSLKKLTMPTLIVHGDADIVPVKCVKTIHNSISGSKFILMSQCGSFPFVEDPENYFTNLNSFLD